VSAPVGVMGWGGGDHRNFSSSHIGTGVIFCPLKPHTYPLRTRVVVLRCLREVCSDGQLLVDLFVNYDCDLNSSNLFERLVNGLVSVGWDWCCG